MIKEKLKSFKENFGDPEIILIDPVDIKFGHPKFNVNGKKVIEYEKIQKSYDWEKLENSFKTKGYLPDDHSYISISRDGYCIDGHHRLVVLRKLNMMKTIQVKKMKYSHRYITFVSAIFHILTLNLIK